MPASQDSFEEEEGRVVNASVSVDELFMSLIEQERKVGSALHYPASRRVLCYFEYLVACP
jgi:hypothetical protein